MSAAATATATTAAAAGLVRCPGCEKLHPRAGVAPGAPCGRCGAALHHRSPGSLQRTWALTIAAAALYVPANVFPVMVIEQFGKAEAATILSGIQALFAARWYPIALVILFASILVPMLKLVGLSGLLLAVHWRSRWNPRQRTVIYRMVEAIGRWSMLDMFTTSLLVALVHLGGVMTIEPGLGATCFAGVVISTMFAAQSFDPRLIWDAMEEER
jgi:paraquat-inducible protein A